MKIGPWGILAALFVARMGMGFQFQLIASTAPQLQPAFSLSYGNIGTLIGLFMLPGAVLALPASWLGARFGERRLAAFGLALMALGAALCAVASDYQTLLAGRLLAGFGGILMNVLMTKLVMDWFVGGNMVLAMAIFVNSWPVSIGLALLVQAPLATLWGWPAAFWSGTALALLGLVVFLAIHRAPPGAAMVVRGRWPERKQWPGLLMAAATWATFNMSFALIFSFGPTLLASRGSDVVGANALVSLMMWISAISVPLGAAIIQRLDGARFSAPLALFAYAATILYLMKGNASLPALLAIAIVGGIPAGACMALVSRVLGPATRTLGMGVFYAVFYAGMALGPVLAGRAIDVSGDKTAPLLLAVGLDLIAGVLYVATTLRLRAKPVTA
jgi:predicted MFS family arabinose efflux permease